MLTIKYVLPKLGMKTLEQNFEVEKKYLYKLLYRGSPLANEHASLVNRRLVTSMLLNYRMLRTFSESFMLPLHCCGNQ